MWTGLEVGQLSGLFSSLGEGSVKEYDDLEQLNPHYLLLACMEIDKRNTIH